MPKHIRLAWRLGRPALAAVLLLIALTAFVALAAELRARGGLEELAEAAPAALEQTGDMILGALSGEYQLSDEWSGVLTKSLGLIVLATLVGVTVGLPLGIYAAVHRHRRVSTLLIGASVLGISTPSYVAGMMLIWAVVAINQRTGVRILPTFGFGWDLRLILPVATLALRPMATMLRMSYAALGDLLEADFVRTAHSKGLTPRSVYRRHVLRNAGVPLLTTVAVSLRSTLSVLPIVEILFSWPGIGLALLRATGSSETVSLVLPLAVIFVAVQAVLEAAYPLIDPRLAAGLQEEA